jgi:cytochrome c553
MRSVVWLALLALLPAAAVAADRPNWAFPPDPPDKVTLPPDDGQPKHVAGSTKAYTQKQIDDQMHPPDWFPDEHPQMPPVVEHGNGTTVRACIGCHLPTGHGHPENSRLPGATAAYLARQLDDFRSGARKGTAPLTMINIAKGLTADEMRTSVAYFAALPVFRWTKVVEADTVPRSFFKGGRRLQHPDGGTEPIGNRIVEIPQDLEGVEHRDPHSPFVSYVPPGSLAKGKALVETGEGKTIQCAICHGVGLRGLGDVPGIAGRSPGSIARQLYYIQTGERDGAMVALMKAVVDKLNGDDVLAISAYVASLEP